MARWLEHHHIDFLTLAAPRTVLAERLQISALSVSPKSRTGVREKTRAKIQATRTRVQLQAGDLLVPMSQPLAPLAALMLDPRSANTLYQELSWQWLAPGEFSVFPVLESVTTHQP